MPQEGYEQAAAALALALQEQGRLDDYPKHVGQLREEFGYRDPERMEVERSDAEAAKVMDMYGRGEITRESAQQAIGNIDAAWRDKFAVPSVYAGGGELPEVQPQPTEYASLPRGTAPPPGAVFDPEGRMMAAPKPVDDPLENAKAVAMNYLAKKGAI